MKENIPEEWHFKNNPRVAPILAVADDGFAFQDYLKEISEFKKENYPDCKW